MGKVKIINSTFELALRFLAIMRICTYPLSEYRLRAYSYLCIHLSDIEDSSTDIHPALPYRSSLFMATQEILHPALHILLTKGLIDCVYENAGIRYKITRVGCQYIDMIRGEYKQVLLEAISNVDEIFQSFTDDYLRSEITAKIKKWGSEFDNENILVSEEYE